MTIISVSHCVSTMSSAGTVALHLSMCSFSHRPSPPSNSLHQPNTYLSSHPHPMQESPSNLKRKSSALRLWVWMQVKHCPRILTTATMVSIQSIIFFLRSKGIQQKDLPRILGMCPKILTSDIKTELIPVFSFLSQDLEVPDHSFRKVINKCPRLLTSSVVDQLKPTLSYLQRLGFKDLAALAYLDSVLLVSSVEKILIPKLKYLESLGFSKDEAIEMVLRCPSMFTFSIENNFQPKFEFFIGEMGRKLEELKDFPQYFAFSLENRIKPRHMEVVQAGVNLPLSMMLKSTDQEFRRADKAGSGLLREAFFFCVCFRVFRKQ